MAWNWNGRGLQAAVWELGYKPESPVSTSSGLRMQGQLLCFYSRTPLLFTLCFLGCCYSSALPIIGDRSRHMENLANLSSLGLKNKSCQA